MVEKPRQSSLAYLYDFLNEFLLLSWVVRISSLLAAVGVSSTLHDWSDYSKPRPIA